MVIFDITHVDGPVLVPPLGGEGHRLRLVALGRCGPRRAERPAPRQDAAAGARAQVDTLLSEGGVDAELAEFGVGLQPPDRRHRPEGSASHATNDSAAGRLQRPI